MVGTDICNVRETHLTGVGRVEGHERNVAEPVHGPHGPEGPPLLYKLDVGGGAWRCVG